VGENFYGEAANDIQKRLYCLQRGAFRAASIGPKQYLWPLRIRDRRI